MLKLAAGLGLPELYAARFARKVTITDREPLAETFVRKSIRHLQLKNVTAKTLNWREAPDEPLPDVVLMSDMNYEPEIFEELQEVIHYYQANHSTAIICTPQHLVANFFLTGCSPVLSCRKTTP